MNDSKEFQDAETICFGNSHVTSRPESFPPHPNPEGMLSRSFRSAEPQRRAAKHLWHAWYIGKRFCKSTCIFISSLSSRIESMEFVNRRARSIRPQWSKVKGQKHYQDLRCQPGPSAKKSVIFSGRRLFKKKKIYGADQQRLQISDLHFDKFHTPATFACWKIRFKTEVCTCSQFPTEAMQWFTEMENGWFSGWIKNIYSWYFNAEFWSTRCQDCSALNRIVHNSHSKEESVWRNERPKFRTVSFAAGR